MYALLPARAKPSKSASTDETRPILTYAELRQRNDAWELVTCDSYQLARVPLQVIAEPNGDEPDGDPLTPGPISAAALKEIEKARSRGFRANGTVAPCNTNGVPLGQTFARPTDVGQFPAWDQLTPDPPSECDTFLLRVNAKLLYALSQSIGADHGITLRVDLGADKDGMRPTSQLRPIAVSANGCEYDSLLMPIRP
jgi:hypothetical protein